MAYSSAEKNAHRAVIIWALISLTALITQATILILISLSTESVDCRELAAEYERRLAVQQSSNPERVAKGKTQGKSLKELINLITSCSDGLAVRVIELTYEHDRGTVRLEAQNSADLDTAVRALLIHDLAKGCSLIEQTGLSATVGISSWVS